MKTLYVIVYGGEEKTVVQFSVDTWEIEGGALLLYLKDETKATQYSLHTAIARGEWIAASLDRESLCGHEPWKQDEDEDNEAEKSYNPGV